MYKTLELQILKEEENVLKDIEAKLKSQLTRLRVEELTLVNHASSAEAQKATSGLVGNTESLPVSDQLRPENEMEQNAKPLLDLDVNNQLLMLMGEGEEEDEEEEEDEDEDEDITEHDQLTAFMKQLEEKTS